MARNWNLQKIIEAYSEDFTLLEVASIVADEMILTWNKLTNSIKISNDKKYFWV